MAALSRTPITGERDDEDWPAILRRARNVRVGDVIRGLDPTDRREWTTVEMVERFEYANREYNAVMIQPGLGMFPARDEEEWVEVRPAEDWETP